MLEVQPFNVLKVDLINESDCYNFIYVGQKDNCIFGFECIDSENNSTLDKNSFKYLEISKEDILNIQVFENHFITHNLKSMNLSDVDKIRICGELFPNLDIITFVSFLNLIYSIPSIYFTEYLLLNREINTYSNDNVLNVLAYLKYACSLGVSVDNLKGVPVPNISSMKLRIIEEMYSILKLSGKHFNVLSCIDNGVAKYINNISVNLGLRSNPTGFKNSYNSNEYFKTIDKLSELPNNVLQKLEKEQIPFINNFHVDVIKEMKVLNEEDFQNIIENSLFLKKTNFIEDKTQSLLDLDFYHTDYYTSMVTFYEDVEKLKYLENKHTFRF